MDYSLSRHTDLRKNTGQTSTQHPKSSIVTMSAPSPYSAFRRNDLPWDTVRGSSGPCRPHTESKHATLPSIRQTFPDLHIEGSLADVAANRQSTRKPAPPMAGLLASPEYMHSPHVNRKRLICNEVEQESLRTKQVPRLYCSPRAPQTRQLSPRRSQPEPLSARGHWAGTPPRSSSHAPIAAVPPPVQMNGPVDTRPPLPTLPPTVKFQRDVLPSHRPLKTTAEPANGPRPAGANPMPPTRDRPSYQSQEYGYAFQHPSRFQSLSTSSVRSHDGAPFSAGAIYGSHYPDMGRYGDLGGTSTGGDAKRRKRCSNLPRETTGKVQVPLLRR